MHVGFVGYVALGTSTYTLIQQTTNSSGVPTAADTDAVAYRIYAPSGGAALLTGVFSTTVVDSQTGYYITGSLAITSGNGFAAGNTYRVRITYAISSTTYVREQSFCVV